jgi:hypothetical protein
MKHVEVCNNTAAIFSCIFMMQSSEILSLQHFTGVIWTTRSFNYVVIRYAKFTASRVLVCVVQSNTVDVLFVVNLFV